MNIDRSPGDFERAAAGAPGPVGRTWAGVKSWSSRNPRLSRVVWFAVALVILAGIIWAIYPPKNQARRGQINSGAQPVGVAKAISGDINVTLNALGTVTPLSTATVRPQVGGMLIKLNFTEGQMVKAGETLAQIDPRPYQASLDQARGQLARDAATLANAKVDLQRYQALLAQNAIAQQQVATQAATVRSTEGIVVSDQANVETARINLGYTNIVSPVEGRAGIHLVDIGNIVQAGQSNGIVVVTQLDPMSVLFTIPEDRVAQVVTRVNSGATLPVDVYDRAQVNKITSGNLSAVDTVVDPTTGSVKLRALFGNKDSKLFPAQFVNVKLLVDTLHNVTVVPVAAIQRGADGSYVFVVTPEKTVNQHNVKTGVQDGNNIQVLSGVNPGDTVVVDGADRLRDGADVEIPNQNVKITAPSGNGEDDAARAARRAQTQAAVTKSCGEDLKKLCPDAKPGSREMRMCLFQNRDDLSADCSKAMSQMRRGGAGGRRGGGGGAAP
ncbi:MAG: efflux RND transporter periplasmic adaptor subunit [Alphaproteobacteria bacterium]|nr:efflux RND transporter periplasmic adaptor subunit [Alphaproteobacteria bacterium]